MKTKLIAIIVTIISLTSCSAMRSLVGVETVSPIEPELNRQWNGRSYAEIVMSFGAPTRVAPDGKGGNIYVYEEIKTKYTSKSERDIFDDIETNTTVSTVRDFTEFYVDAQDKCYLVRSNRREPDGGYRVSVIKTTFLVGLVASLTVSFLGLLYML